MTSPMRDALNGIRQVTATINGWMGAYASLQGDREPFKGWKVRPATATQAIGLSLTTLVAQCRHLERTTPWARAVSDGLCADMIGTGVDVLPDTGDEDLDARIYDEFQSWAEHALVDGRSLWSWQSIAPREYLTSGNLLGRYVILPERVKRGWIPLAILPLETEWLSELAVGPIAEGNRFIRGIEVDALGRRAFYHLRNPETLNFYKGERVPAEQIIHDFEFRRAQQIFGEPILAPAVERVLQDDRLVRSELQGSVNASAPAVLITSEFHQGTTDDNGDPITEIPTGSVGRLLPGEKVETVAPERPNEKLAPFRGTIRGDIAGACKTSQFWLDRDASRANYSSMRMDQLLTKRALGALKQSCGRAVAGDPYQRVFPWLMLSLGEQMPSGAREIERMTRYFLRPDQPEYVDPVKDVAASRNAIAENLSTYDIELSSRNKNWRAVFKQRALENAALTSLGLPVPQPEKAAAQAAAIENATITGKPDNIDAASADNADTEAA